MAKNESTSRYTKEVRVSWKKKNYLDFIRLSKNAKPNAKFPREIVNGILRKLNLLFLFSTLASSIPPSTYPPQGSQ